MGCLRGSIEVGSSIRGVVSGRTSIVGKYDVDAPVLGNLCTGSSVRGDVLIYPPLLGKIGTVCLANGDYVIAWKEPLLVWAGADNREGVVKYNQLKASHSWQLEEVTIEELL